MIMPKWVAQAYITIFLATVIVVVLTVMVKFASLAEWIFVGALLASLGLVWAAHSLDIHRIREKE